MANILICDDERDIVSALKIYLSSEGHTLFEAYTGREALEAEVCRLRTLLADYGRCPGGREEERS